MEGIESRLRQIVKDGDYPTLPLRIWDRLNPSEGTRAGRPQHLFDGPPVGKEPIQGVGKILTPQGPDGPQEVGGKGPEVSQALKESMGPPWTLLRRQVVLSPNYGWRTGPTVKGSKRIPKPAEVLAPPLLRS